MKRRTMFLAALGLVACGGPAGMDPRSVDTGSADTGWPDTDSGTGGSDTQDTADTDPHDTDPSDTATTLVLATPTALADATPGWFGQVAYSPPAGAWLVATQAGGIAGRMMGDDGAPRTDVFTISPADQTTAWAPSVAYAPGTDTFLVVWVDYTVGWQAWARFVASDGTMAGEAFPLPIDQPVTNMGGDRTSALAWDEPNRRFVYVWNGTHLATIGLDGALGAVVNLTAASPDEHWGASVAVDPDHGEYCVGYDRRNDASFGLTPVNAATLLAGTESTAPITTTNVLVLYNAVERRHLVVYDTGYVTGVRAMLLGSCDLGDVVATFDVWPGIATVSAAWNPVSNQYAVIAQNAENDGNTYVVFDSTGALLTSGDPYLGESGGNYEPEIAPNTVNGTFAAISSREYAQTRFVGNVGFLME